MVRFYQTLDEALEDIGFNGRKRVATLLNGLNAAKKFDYGQPAFDEIMKWLFNFLQNQKIAREHTSVFLQMFCDVAANAYREDIQIHGAETVQASCYLGNQGILLGTKQTRGFLRPEQLELLRSGKNVPSTDERGCGGHGTRSFFEYGKGLLLLEKEKEIHVSMSLDTKFDERFG
jgi:hypothetical protein